MFGDVNVKVGTITAEIGATLQVWNSNIFSLIQTLSETVIIMISGIIIIYSEAGDGLIIYGNVMLPFVDRFPTKTRLR